MSKYLFSLLFFASVFGETLFVQLATEVPLIPVSISGDSTLIDILKFDFAHNGRTKLVEDKGSATYLIQAEIQEKKLNVRIVGETSVKTVENIPLTGELRQDRRIIHQVSDSIFKALFGKEGVASTHILYAVKTKDPATKKWVSAIYEADYDGGNARQVCKSHTSSITPSYIPPKSGCKSSGYLFVSYQSGQPKIYFGNLQNEETHRFSLLKGNQLLPVMSRQRDKIAFISDVTGNPDLFLQEFNDEKGLIGKPRQIFSTARATQGSPSFSPDGKQIAFVSNKDGSPQVYVMAIPEPNVELKNIKAKLITKINRENTAPAWSPDGSKIAYCAQSKGARQIWLYDFATNAERQLTQDTKNKENPTWAPDSLHLIFNTSDSGDSELYLMNLNQPDAVKITTGPGEKYFPSWEVTGGVL